MNIENIIEESTEVFKNQLESELKDLSEGQLSSEKAALFTKSMQKAISQAALTGYQNFLQSHESQEATEQVDGQRFRFKQDSEKPGKWP